MKDKLQTVVVVAVIGLSALSIFAHSAKPSRMNQWISDHQKHLEADKAWGGSYTVTLYKNK